MYARMVIGETVNEDQVREFARIYTREVLPELETEPGFSSARLMVEEDGRMAVSLTLENPRGLHQISLQPLLPPVCRENPAPAVGRFRGEAV